MFLRKITQISLLRNVRRPIALAEFSTSDGSSSSDDDSKNEKKPRTASGKQPTSESAADRLNRLLASMSTEDSLPQAKTVKVPQAGARKQKRAEQASKEKEEQKPDNIVQAAKRVAELVGDKSRQTEAELLSKLLNHVDGGSSKSGQSSTDGDGASQSLSDLIVGMKIDRSKKGRETPSRGEFVRKTIASRRAQQPSNADENVDARSRPRRKRPTEPVPSTGSVNLFGDTLGIFKDPKTLRPSPDILETWNYLYNRELKLTAVHPPANYFEKMILWTEQGKIWKFPIDNEQGLDDEAQVDFSEHVFLEQHLDGWCPERGPVRHFMELVCVGLSKNPYIKAHEKKEHIMWYRDYFESKKDLLKQVIVDQKEAAAGKGSAKKLEA